MLQKIQKIIAGRLCHYNHEKYWTMRQKVVDQNSKCPLILRYYYWFKLKKIEGKNNSIIGTTMGGGAVFKGVPTLPHHLNGIIISTNAVIGENCTIMQQVTIGAKVPGDERGAVIGDNVLIGAGAKIIGNVEIGDNVKIGANAVVVDDIPANCTVVGVPAKIINKLL